MTDERCELMEGWTHVATSTFNQAVADGWALRRLREALPVDALVEFWMMKYPSHHDWGVTVIMNDEDEPLGFSGDTIAEAADECREALG